MSLTHIEHIEDLLLERSSDSAAFFVLKKSLEELKTAKTISVKYDGAPSIVCGLLDGKFFLSTKSIFNKTPKIAFTINDIKTLFKGELQIKLQAVFNALKDEKFTNIIQFDLIGTKKEYQKNSLVQNLVPNVVEYRIHANIEKYDIVIAVHSVYESKTITELQLETPKVAPFMKFKCAYNLSTESKLELSTYTNIDSALNMINSFSNELSDAVLTEFKCFINNSIRKMYFYYYEDTADVIDKFSSFVFEKYKNQILDYKTEKARTAKALELSDLVLDILSSNTFSTIEKILQITKELEVIKRDVINCLQIKNVSSSIGTLNQHEGAVIKIEDTLVKIVNRYVFSAENFLKNETTFKTKNPACNN